MARTAATRRDINNLVTNGDFEYAPAFTAVTTTNNRWVDGTAGGSTTNDAYRWGIASMFGSAAASFDSANPYTGTQSLKLSTTAVTSFVEAHQARLDTAAGRYGYAIPVLPSTDYTGKFRMKTTLISGDSNHGAAVNFRTFDGALAAVATPTSASIKTTTAWTEYTVTFTTGATVAFVVPVCLVYGHSGTGTLILDAWFDNVTLGPSTPITRAAA